MQLPKLTTGKRFTLPQPKASSDSLWLSQLALQEKTAGRPLLVVTADAATATRLLDEMAFFAPGVRGALFPDW